MPTPILLPAAPKVSRLGRVLAALQAGKETLSFLLLLLPLAQQAPLALLSALPGMGLYILHLYLAVGRADRRLAVGIWGFTLIDEAWAMLLYYNLGQPVAAQQIHLSHCLGTALSLLALAELAWRWRHHRRRPVGVPRG